MRRASLLCLALALTACCASPAAGQGIVVSGFRMQASWRPLLHYLPGAYRFLDRLDLTEEQEKALGKVYKDWQAQRREAYRDAAAKTPPLSADDRKDPEKAKAYYAKRAELYKAAQVPPSTELIEDLLSVEQLAKIREADRVVAEWEGWVAAHMAKYDQKLVELLGPVPKDRPAAQEYMYRRCQGLLKGGALLGRLRLTDEQFEKLKALQGQYYAEWRTTLAPIGQSFRDGRISGEQRNELLRVVNNRTRSQAADRYAKLFVELLTAKQRELFQKAVAIVEERDKAIWERYSQYVRELSVVLPESQPAPSAP